ncbi:MAG: hypothetical protein M3198_04450 [Actinomycetota bacterium]|nr:hypothetical protein [Actinomycetota bacterium]
MRLKNFAFVGQDRLLELYDQLKASGGLRLKGGRAGVKTPVVHAEAELERVERAPEEWAQLVEIVTGGLRESGQLSAFRPQSLPDYERFRVEGWSYVSESDLRATRVQVPVSDELQDDGAPPSLTVWVADPDQLQGSENGPSIVGTFLYLVEDLAPAEPPPPHFYSGASALAHVARLAQPSVARPRYQGERSGDPNRSLQVDAHAALDQVLLKLIW